MSDRPPETGASHAQASALERLREHVERAADAIERLRAENERLQARVAELERQSAPDADGAHVALDDDPEVLREKIEGFIEAIDYTLAEDHTQG